MGRITLRGVRAMGRHGAAPGEREREQPFDLDATIDFDSSAAEVSDQLGDTIDYAELHERMCAVVATTSFALLERLGAAVLDAVFEDARVLAAEVTVAKPGILAGATPSVTLRRERR